MKTFSRTLRLLGGIVLILLLVGAIWIGPVMYRVFHGLDVYETTPPQLPAELKSPAILVFSKTNGFRDDASIRAANAMFREIAGRRGWGVFVTENGAAFNPAQLARFDAVVWNNVSGDVLTPAQREAFKGYLGSGGGYVGVHGAGGDPSYRWRWYVEDLIGTQFIGHTVWPHLQVATIHVEDAAHPAMAGVPTTWRRKDEWYSFDHSVRGKGYRVLASLDEATYEPKGLLLNDLSMAGDHPIVWSHCVGRGRAFYSALGHAPETYTEPLHRLMLENAIAWAATNEACEDGR